MLLNYLKGNLWKMILVVNGIIWAEISRQEPKKETLAITGRTEGKINDGITKSEEKNKEMLMSLVLSHEILWICLFDLILSGIWQNSEEIVEEDGAEDIEGKVCPKNPVISPPEIPENIAASKVLISRSEGTVLTLPSGIPIVELPGCSFQITFKILAARLPRWGIKTNHLSIRAMNWTTV